MVRSLKEIARALGGEVSCGQVLAPGPGHSKRDRSLAVRPNGDDYLAHSFAGQDWRGCRDYVHERLGSPERAQFVPRAQAPQARGDSEQRVEYALKIWRQTTPLTASCLGWRYFTERRGLHIGLLHDLSHAVRWHGGISAVVALMTDPATNVPTGIHRTFLNSDGTKRERKMLGRQGVIRVSPDDQVTMGLGVVEGLEDGLAVLLSGWSPIWVATSAGGIDRFPVLPGIECLTIFSDADATGIKVAEACAARWIAAGREACISLPREVKDAA